MRKKNLCNNCAEFVRYINENRYHDDFELPDHFCKRPLESNGRMNECLEEILQEKPHRQYGYKSVQSKQ